MVKWRARDSGEIALFQRYRVVPGADQSYVWYGPKEGWTPGEYQVDVYSGDESLQLVASGRYRVR